MRPSAVCGSIEIECEESVVFRGVSKVHTPSEAGLDAHRRTHVPDREWCTRPRKEIRRVWPVIGMDYMLLIYMHNFSILVVTDSQSGEFWFTPVIHKGNYNVYISNSVASFLDKIGHATCATQ